MKKTFLSAGILSVLFALSSCKKDWKCDCTDGNVTNTVAIYPDTKLLDAKEKCDKVQSDLQNLNSNISCRLK